MRVCLGLGVVWTIVVGTTVVERDSQVGSCIQRTRSGVNAVAVRLPLGF